MTFKALGTPRTNPLTISVLGTPGGELVNDFAPGTTAYLQVEGVTPGAMVEVQVVHLVDAGVDDVLGSADDTLGDNSGRGHSPWLATDGGPGDADGMTNGVITTGWYVDSDDSLGETFRATASELLASADPSVPVLGPTTATTLTDSAGSYSLKWYAADPALNNGLFLPTYSKLTPVDYVAQYGAIPTAGRAADPLSNATLYSPTASSNPDGVSSLMPKDLTFGQIVPFYVDVAVNGSTALENGTIRINPYWLGKTTSGGDFGFDVTKGIIAAFVDTADPGNKDPGKNATVTNIAWNVANAGTNNEQIAGAITVGGLDDGDHAVVEIWVVLDSVIGSVTGNVQTGLTGAFTGASGGTSINVGNQTVPLLQVGDFTSKQTTADLYVLKSDNAGTMSSGADADPVVRPGDLLTYYVQAGNSSTDTVANAVVVTDTLDPRTTFISATNGGTASNGVITWSLGGLSPNQTKTLQATVKVNDTVAGGITLNDTASISALTADSTSSNNSNAESTVITAPLVVPGSITGQVFLDANADGTRGSGESGLAGITVTLLDANGTAVTGQSISTTATGAYSFTGVTPGQYSVQFSKVGYSFSPADQGSDTADSDVTAIGTAIGATSGKTSPITVASGQSVTNVDAGLWKAASITGLAFIDTNGDGIQGTSEAGFAGQSVQLLNAAGIVVASTTTGSNGAYSFGNVTPGTYQVQFVAASSTSFTAQDQGSNDAADSDVGNTGRSAAISLTSGQTVANLSAGSFTPATITGQAFTDLNSDGVRQTGETVLPGVTAQLLNTGGTVVTSATTDSSGNYSLSAAPGTYTIKFVTPTGYSLSPQDRGSDDTLDSDANPTTGTTAAITLASGQSVTNVDAGLWQKDDQSGGSTSSGSTVYGSGANDLFHGTNGPDLFYGNGGADWFDGGAGKDVLFGADQADTMLGGTGNDTAYGAGGADLIQGGDGADRLYAGSGDDTVQGDDPATLPLGANYDDLIEAGAGNDLIFGGAGNDEMQGEGDDDTIAGGTDYGSLAFADPVHPVASAPTAVVIGDNLYGNGGRDTFLFARGDGVDMLWDFDATQDAIQISGYSRSNIAAVTFVTSVVDRGRSNGYPLDAGSHEKLALILNASGDAIIFNDFANRSSERPAIRFDNGWLSAADLYARATPGGGGHQLPDPGTGTPGGSGEGGAGGNAVLQGTEAADSLTAYGWNNQIDAGAGNDTINGGEGNAVINAGDGNNIITVGGWNNTVLAGNGGTRLSGPQGNTSVHFGNGDHFVQLGGYVNTVVLGIGNSVVDAGQSNSSIKIAGGNNIVVARGWSNQIQTSDGNDNISGIAGNSTIEAGGGDNRVTAAGSSNLITTGDGRDVIFAGDDTAMVHTGGGDDTVALQSWGNHLWAGNGNDVVLLGASDGDGSIDGEAGTDTVVVTGSTTEYRFGVGGGSVYINGPGAKSYELRDVELIAFHGGANEPQALSAVLAQAGLQQMAAQTADGVSSFVMPDLYSGPVAYLQYQLLGSNGGEAVASTTSNDFLNLLGGDDAAIGGAGDDVLDGGTGSNFLGGGTGHDVFFIDGRSVQSTWSTISDWEAGEQLSIWGWHPGISRVGWEEMAGTAGYQGATLHLDFDANGSWDASVTWSGVARSQLPTPHEYDGLLWFT